MPMKVAKRLCPEAIILRGDSGLYPASKERRGETEVVRAHVPRSRRAAWTSSTWTSSGTDRFFGSWKLATELRQRIAKETGLPNSIGSASTRR